MKYPDFLYVDTRDPKICWMSLWIEFIFLHADCDAIIFGKTNILLYIFDF